MKLKNILLTTAFLGLASVSVFAQDAAKDPKATTPTRELDRWSVGVNAGTLLFYGDIRQYDFYPVTTFHNEWSLGYGLKVSRSFNSVFSLEGYVLNGKLSGTRRDLDRYFEADLFEYGFNVGINFSNITFSQRTKPRRLTFYGTVGMGLASFRSQLYTLYPPSDVKLTDVGFTSGKRTTETVIPFGLGIKYKISNKIDIGLETTLHNINTDVLDVTPSIPKGSLDKYSYSDLTVTYKFGDKADVNEWVNPLDALYADNAAIKSKIEGLSTDTDKDGVADIFDKDNATPDGTKVYGDGTAVDTDGDGVPDSADADPFTPKGAKVDSKGKEADADGDGVADSKDMEPNTAAGSLVNFQGKTIQVGKSSTSTEVSGVYLPSIYFASNSSVVQYKYYENLASIARTLKANPSLKLTIIGNADAKGSDKANEKLAMKRAEAVAQHLQKVYNIEASRVSTQSKGKSEMLGKADAINRRVDFKVTK